MSPIGAKDGHAPLFLGAVAVVLVVSACGGDDAEEPRASDDAGSQNSGGRSEQLELGEAVFARNCASCHGNRGRGGLGPKLAEGRVVDRYPEVKDHLKIVVEGRGQMPAWGDELSDEEIDAVVRYEREAL